jgi:hypothetical protein
MTRETKSLRRERRQKKDRDRQQVRRDGMKARRKPDTHAIHSAITEAFAYLIAKPDGSEEFWARRRVTALQVMDLARQILATRYDPTQSGKAMLAKLQPRERYHWILPAFKQSTDDEDGR